MSELYNYYYVKKHDYCTYQRHSFNMTELRGPFENVNDAVEQALDAEGIYNFQLDSNEAKDFFETLEIVEIPKPFMEDDLVW